MIGLTLADCSGGAPKGQVVAVVNGQEVTGQDLAAEARAAGGGAGQSAPLVLQRVVARILLAQAAHAQKLDRYPGYPSDLARLQQTFLADKTLQAVVKPVGRPQPADIERLIAAHPYAFRERQKIQVDEIRFQSADEMKSLQGETTLAGVASRLRTLNVPFDRATRTIDTAELPAPLSQRLVAAPLGQLFFLHQGEVFLAMVVLGRQSAAVPPEQQTALAAELMSRIATQAQVDGVVRRLRAQAKISYQPGYAPAPPSSATPATAGADAHK